MSEHGRAVGGGSLAHTGIAMAEKAEKKPEAAPAAAKKDDHAKDAAGGAAAAKGGGLLAKTPVMLGGVMLIEAAVLFAGFKFIGGGSPRAAAGAELIAAEKGLAGGLAAGGKATSKDPVELPLVDFRAPNKLSGRTFLYDVSVYLVVRQDDADRVKDILSSRDALIKDRIRTIIAESDPDKLGGGSEPGLETLRRQIKYQMDEIVGDGMIEEVLIPRCTPFRTDY